MRVCSLCRVTPCPGGCARMVAHAGTVLWGPGPQAGARTGLRSRAATPPSGCSSRGASAGRTATLTRAASRRCTNRTRAGSAGRAKKLGFSFSDRGNCAHEHTFTLKCGAHVRYFWYKDHTHTVLTCCVSQPSKRVVCPIDHAAGVWPRSVDQSARSAVAKGPG